MTFDLQQVVRPNIWGLKPYRCARDDYSEGILLDANENTHGPSLGASVRTAYSTAQLERYPDPHQLQVKEALCALRGIPSPAHFFLGVGSDECIDMVLRVFCTPGRDKILITPPTYGMYSVSAQINDVAVVKVPLDVQDGAFQLNVPEMLSALSSDPHIKVVMLCSPGNPTGTLLRQSDIRAILECKTYRGVVVVDEAYIDFCDDVDGEPASVAAWVLKYPNLIVSQTLSKAFGLAGIRMGFTVSSPEIAQIFNNTKAPYNISTPTSNIALSALGAEGLSVKNVHIAMIKKERALLMQQVLQLPRVSRLLGTHDANFILVQLVNKSGEPDNDLAHSVYKELAETHRVVVRFRGMELGCPGCLRVTVGTAEENQVLLERLKGLLQ
ncbi:histidinol-phosphate transaminase [Kappamyces sp. JEL0829]|nr:histidinol-phosphate transaminase [Kappamyces sp. JEL0829]